MPTSFRNITIHKPDDSSEGPKLAAPRSYSLSLSPCLLYTRSALLPALVSSKAHEQLEFLAVGSWFVWRPSPSEQNIPSEGSLMRVPNSREDIFSDSSLSLRAKSALVKFLRFVAEYQNEEKRETWEAYRDAPFADLLSKQFKVPADFHGPLLALTMSSLPSEDVKTEFALQSIHRHLTSMGVFGAGFSAVLPKYGGLSEVVQVACRAAAVGGAICALDRRIESVEKVTDATGGTQGVQIRVSLQDGDTLATSSIFGTNDQLPNSEADVTSAKFAVCSRSTTIVGSKLLPLFPASAEGSPPPSAAVAVFPSGSLAVNTLETTTHPVSVLVHAGDTGECPQGQCVVYAMTMQESPQASQILKQAVDSLLSSVDAAAPVLWSMQYEVCLTSSEPAVVQDPALTGLYRFVESPLDTVFDDRTLASVKEAWKLVTGETDDTFLSFGDRNVEADEDAAQAELDE